MSGLFKSNTVTSFLDPANFSRRRPGGINIRGALDPGGAKFKAITGSDIGHELADPLRLYPTSNIMTTSTTPTVSSSEAAKAAETKAVSDEKLKNYQKLKDKRRRTIMVAQTELDDFSSNGL